MCFGSEYCTRPVIKLASTCAGSLSESFTVVIFYCKNLGLISFSVDNSATQIASEAIKVTSKMLPPPRRGGRLSGKYFDKHIRSKYFCYHSKEEV